MQFQDFLVDPLSFGDQQWNATFWNLGKFHYYLVQYIAIWSLLTAGQIFRPSSTSSPMLFFLVVVGDRKKNCLMPLSLHFLFIFSFFWHASHLMQLGPVIAALKMHYCLYLLWCCIFTECSKIRKKVQFRQAASTIFWNSFRLKKKFHKTLITALKVITQPHIC